MYPVLMIPTKVLQLSSNAYTHTYTRDKTLRRVTMKKPIIATLLATIMVLLIASPVLATPSSWAAETVEEAIRRGLVPTNLQSNYQAPTTRAEFAALAVALYQHHHGVITGRISFTDTTDTAVEKAAYIGIVAGVGGGRFNPDGNLTREQAAVLVFRLMEAMGYPILPVYPYFADRANIAYWARLEVGGMQHAGIMSGVGNSMFAPQVTYTREQSIATMMRVHEILMPFIGIAELNLAFEGITDAMLAEMVADGRIPAHITALRLTGNYITDISPLGYLTNLEFVDLMNNQVVDISPLGNLQHLKVLHLVNNPISDISALSNLTGLQGLGLMRTPITDLSPLGNLTALTNLSFSTGFYRGNNISFISNLTNLRNLMIDSAGVYLVADFSPIASLRNLETLAVWNADFFNDMSIISDLTNLLALNIVGINIQNISALNRLSNLNTIIIQGCNIRDLSDFSFDSLPNLRTLDLSRNEITDITPLTSLRNLELLAISYNRISQAQINRLQATLPGTYIINEGQR